MLKDRENAKKEADYLYELEEDVVYGKSRGRKKKKERSQEQRLMEYTKFCTWN